MTAKYRSISFLFIIILFSISVFSQSGLIKGTVEDTAKAPVPGASVILRNKRTGQERVVTTDNEGQFVFGDVAGGDFEVIATAPGFARSAVSASSGDSSLVISITPEQLKEEVTVVSGSRQEELRESLTTQVNVVTRNDIKATGYENVGEVLREIPGVVTRRGSETSPVVGEQVQGIDSRQVLVLMDGQPITGARGVKSGIINLDQQQVNQLESVEVVKGAASALYGSDAIGGVINMRTRDQTEPFTAGVTVAGGNFGVFDGSADVGFLKGKLSGFGTFGRHKNNGFDLYPSDFSTDGSGYHRYDGYAKLKYQFTPNFSLTGFANSYWNNSKGRVVGEPTDFIDLGKQITDVDDDSQDYGLTGDWAINGKTNLQIRGYLSRFDEIYRAFGYPSGRALPDGNLFERYGKFDATITRVLGDRNLLQGGVEFAKNTYSGLNRLQSDRGEATTQVVWLQDKLNITNRLTLTFGGRFDHHSIFGSATSPKVGLNYRINDNFSVRASWGRGFRAPDLGQLYYNFRNPLFGYQVLGNRNLVPEHSGSWQIGGQFVGFSRKLRLGVNLYRNDVRNLINSLQLGTPTSQAAAQILLANNGLDPSLTQFIQGYPVILFAYKNIQSVYTQGVELDGSYILPFGLSFSGAYTYLDSKDETTPNLIQRYLIGRFKHQGFTKIAYTNSRYGINANFRGSYYSNWWVTSTATTARKAVAFQLFDLYGSKSIAKGFSLYGSIDNIFNNQDPNTGRVATVDRPDAGRTFRVGMRWEFGRKDK